MSEIQTVAVRLSEDVRGKTARASSVRHYDENLAKVFPYFIVGDPGLIGEFSDTLSDGYTHDGYGPFWPSFASVNDGRGDGKVLWISEAGLGCLLTKHQNDYIFDVQERQ
jgi:hypothetical protein